MTIPADWDARLRSAGYRVTAQRRRILEVVEELRHATPDDVVSAARERGADVDLSTVYRALEILNEVGLVSHAHLGPGAVTYHAIDRQPHIHLVCRRCGSVTGADAALVTPLEDSIERGYGFSTDLRHLTLHGLCASCREVPRGQER